MRRFAVLAGLGAVVLAAGCRRELTPDPPSPAVTTAKPSAEQLVAYMNQNAQLVQSIKSTRLEIDAKEGREGVGLTGTLFCQKPRDFRLRATLMGQPAVDIGSNNDEFWFYISKGPDQDGVARVHYCSYNDMAAGKARMPFPFQPDMIVAALGMGEYDPKKEYTIREDAKTYSLVEQAVSAQGDRVQKVTVFNRVQVGPGKPQVLAHILLDDKGNEICRASVLEVQTVQIDSKKVALPQRVQLIWRPQQIEMTMRLYDTQVNSIDAPHAAKLFSRADLSGIPSANLAQGPDRPTGYSESGVRQTQLLAPATK